jgi:adenylate kinase family enzyme
MVFKMLEDRLYSSDCMINGWILTGFPKNSSQMYYLENNINNTFKPSLIVIVDMDEDFSTKRAGTRRIDPTTGKVYYLESNKENEINSHVKERLIVKNEDKKNVLDKRLDNWKKLSEVLLNKNFGNNVLRLNGESNLDNLIENISDAMENAS